MNTSNRSGCSFNNDECNSPRSPVAQAYMEPLLPLPPFDLSILKVARGGITPRKMMVHETATKLKMKTNTSGKSGGGGRIRTPVDASRRPTSWSKFAREVTSGIATENSSDELSDF